MDCIALKAIPNNLFYTLPPAGLHGAGMFANCISLQDIPEHLFINTKYNISIVYVARMFSGCSELKTIPQDILRKNTSLSSRLSLLDYVAYMFKDCVGITGTLPNYGLNDTWTGTSLNDWVGLYQGCINAANYDNIPDNAK